ncbi:hypothetical protein Tco_1164999 [Tanacetum coccineum]
MRRVQNFHPIESEGDKTVPELTTGSSKRDAKVELDHEASKKQKTNEASGDDLYKLWSLVKERFSSTDPTDNKGRTLWVELKRLFEPDTDDILWKLQRYMHDPLTWRLYDTCGVHHVSTDRGHDIFMLVEKDYPLTRGLLTLMLCNKLQVDQYSEMADELLRKIVILANRPRQFCITRRSTKELIIPFENQERVFRSKRRLFETPGLVKSSSPEFDLCSDIEEHSEEEETTEIMTETLEQYMSKTRGNYRSRVARTKINDKTHFKLKGKFLKELHENTFSGLEHEDANKHIKKVLKIIDLFHISEEVILFYNGLDVPTRQILDSKGVVPTKTAADAKPNSTTSGEELRKSTRKYMLLRSDANYAKDHTTQRTVHSRKKGKLLKRLTTHNLEHPINLEDSTKQQG